MGKIGKQGGQRNDQTWKIDLGQNICATDKGIAALVHTALKIVPHDRTGHVKNKLGNAICRNFGDFTEDDGKNNGRNKRLNDKPKRA